MNRKTKRAQNPTSTGIADGGASNRTSLHQFFRALTLCGLIFSSSSALAIYKCDSGGSVTYTASPCADGKGIDLGSKVTIRPSEADNALAAKQSAQEKTELTRLENTRHKREAIEAREQRRAAKANAAKQKKCQSLAQRRKWAAEDAAKATMKAAEKAKLKLRRLDEKIELECGK
ncbi:hypothetical protein BH11PSE11_BH11PSE11_36210 [soil metagenome]